MKSLKLLESCDGCGACCRELSFPPGYQILFVPGLAEAGATSPANERDIERFHRLPPSLKRELQERFDAIYSGRLAGNEPCLWFDAEALRCRHYEHRPEICREFEINAAPCRWWREKYGLDPKQV